MFSLLVKILLVTNVEASLVSSMPSTYTDTGIPNSHLVSENIIRGMAPRNEADIEKLIELGVSNFLIFKIDTNGEVEKEIDILQEKGVEKKHITHLDFPWKDITDFKPVCEMTIEALKILEASDVKNKKIYFHCTVGEDRTGYLAGLYKIYRGNKNTEDVFQGELCDKGYEAGNPKKGMNVVSKVRESLTPSFLSMAEILREAVKNKVPLSKKLCTTSEFNDFSGENLRIYRCKKSRLIH